MSRSSGITACLNGCGVVGEQFVQEKERKLNLEQEGMIHQSNYMMLQANYIKLHQSKDASLWIGSYRHCCVHIAVSLFCFINIHPAVNTRLAEYIHAFSCSACLTSNLITAPALRDPAVHLARAGELLINATYSLAPGTFQQHLSCISRRLPYFTTARLPLDPKPRESVINISTGTLSGRLMEARKKKKTQLASPVQRDPSFRLH